MMLNLLNCMHYFFLLFCILCGFACDDQADSEMDDALDAMVAGQSMTQDVGFNTDLAMSDMEFMGGAYGGSDMQMSAGQTMMDMNVVVEDMVMPYEDMAMSGGESMPILEEVTCEESRADDARLIALSFPYSDVLGEEGRSVQLYRLSATGTLDSWGDRLELSAKSSVLRFSQDGWWLVSVSERGRVTSIDLRGPIPLITDTFDLPLGAYSTVQSSHRSRVFDVVNRNSNELAGLYSLHLDCEGGLALDEDYYYLRLIQGFQRFTSAPLEAIVFGGQALFDPIDPIDLRWIKYDEDGWSEYINLDVFSDFIDAINVGLSPQGDWITLVNGSPFTEEGGQVRFIEINQDPPSLNERFLFEGYSDVRGAWYLPQGDTVLITQFEENAVQFFAKDQNVWRPAQRVEGIGLARHVAMIPPPPQTDERGVWLLIPSVSPTGGSGVSMLQAIDGESVMSLPTYALGDGYTNIPGTIAGWPSESK